ncbi:MAG: caspase family protein [Gammaproteobacteria bacterium]|nr:caspase family protein [Gammaproteobacteria bacterium]
MRCTLTDSKYLPGLALFFLFLISTKAYSYEDILPRYALVIGNSNYAFSPLKNPLNDARDMAKKLRALRYEVTPAYDLNSAQIRQTVASFYKKIKTSNAISLFYYAGHAIQSNNVNYLIPVNAGISNYALLQKQAFSVNELLQAIKTSASQQNIIILDACRNNPFEKTTANKNKRTLAISDKKLLTLPSGLAPIEAPSGTLIAYATEPGNVASDGSGNNGTYTAALLKHIAKSETAEALFKKVRRDVLKASQQRQTPWEHSSLIEKFYFLPPSNEEIPDIVGF